MARTKGRWTRRDAERLRAWRTRHGLSQSKVAAALGVTASRVSELERGSVPSPGLATRLAELRRSKRLTKEAGK